VSTHAANRPRAAAAYGLALLSGTLLAAWLVAPARLFPSGGSDLPLAGDLAQAAIGQRYFVADAWHWTLLRADGLADGVNIAMTDSIPLEAVAIKLLRPALPAGFYGIFLWYALCWVLQPAAAVFALRSAGERRPVPAIAAAAMAASMPAMLIRVTHIALCSHFLLLLALGLYFRLARRAGVATWSAALLLPIVSLLVHPYLMVMVAATLAAAPISLLLRGERRWRGVAALLVAALAVTGALGVLLGYAAPGERGGFGYYSMNLISPFYPYDSTLLPAPEGPGFGTAGQYEGYQYLGAGVLLLLVLCLACLRGRGVQARALLRRHAGLWLAGAALTAFAVSDEIYLGRLHLLDLAWVPPVVGTLRATGRFFWPVGYMLLIGGVAWSARVLPRPAASALLLGAALLQVLDTGALRRMVHREMHARPDWSVPAAALRPLLATHGRLVIWPTFGCGADELAEPSFMQVLLLASETALPVNTMYVARNTGAFQCDEPAVLHRLAAADLLVLLPTVAGSVPPALAAARFTCRRLGRLAVCSHDPGGHPGGD